MPLLRRYRVGLVLLGLLVVMVVLVVYRMKDQQARAVTRPRQDVLVGVFLPDRRDMEVKVSFTADIVPVKQAAIFSKVSGYIRRIHADRGDFVNEGQLLVEIDDQELQASLEQARAILLSGQAGLEMARSSLVGQRANLENQRANLAKARAVSANDERQAERMKQLFERGLVSATDFENARTTAESSRANVQAARRNSTLPRPRSRRPKARSECPRLKRKLIEPPSSSPTPISPTPVCSHRSPAMCHCEISIRERP